MNVNLDHSPGTWEEQLKDSLYLLGHRNWIVVADSAYPAQTSVGIKTVVTSADHLEVLAKTLSAIAESRHVRAKIYMDSELRHVLEEDAPGVTALQREIDSLLKDEEVTFVEHEDVIATLDESGRMYQVLILKSTLTIPYTSVFMMLDCRYWSDPAEKRLRNSMANEARPA
jgi:D-ribose pyranose/furanose isomerase RbsD